MGSSRRRSDCRSACGTPVGPTQPTTTCESTAAFNLHDPGQLGPGRTPAWACSSLRWPGLRLRSTFTDVALPGPRGWSSGHAATSRARTGRSRGRRKGTILRGQPAHGWPEPWHDGPTATFLVALFAAPALVMSSFGFWGRPRLGEDCNSLAAVAEGDTNGTCRSSQGAQRRRDNPRRLTATRSHASDQPGCPARHRGTERWVSRAGPSSGVAGSADRHTGAWIGHGLPAVLLGLREEHH